MFRICIVTSNLSSILNSRLGLINFFKKKGSHIDVYCKKNVCLNGPIDFTFKNYYTRIYSPLFLKLFSYLKETKPHYNILLVYNLPCCILTTFFLKLKIMSSENIIFVVTGYGFWGSSYFSSLKKTISYFISNYSNIIIVQNEIDYNYLNSIGIDTKVELIKSSGIKPLHDHQYILEKINTFTKVYNIGYIGRISFRKGFHNYLIIFLISKYIYNINLNFHVFGNCSSFTKYLLIKIGLHIHHFQKPSIVYTSVDALVYPTHYRDGISRTLVEAMMNGILIFALNSPTTNLTLNNNYSFLSNSPFHISKQLKYISKVDSSHIKEMLVKSYFNSKIYSDTNVLKKYLKIVNPYI